MISGFNCKVRFQFARVSSSWSKFAKESAEKKDVRQKLVLQIWRLSLQAWKQVLQIMRSTLFWERNSKEIPLGSTRRIWASVSGDAFYRAAAGRNPRPRDGELHAGCVWACLPEDAAGVGRPCGAVLPAGFGHMKSPTGISAHLRRLPRKGRGAGAFINQFYGSRAFIELSIKCRQSLMCPGFHGS